MNLKPIKNKVIVELVIQKQDTTEGGIILTGDPDLRSQKFKVIAVGDSVTDVKPGDIVLVEIKYSMEIKIREKNTGYLLEDKHIMAVLDTNK